MNKLSSQFSSIQQVTNQYLNQNVSQKETQNAEVSFADVLKQKQEVQAFENSSLKFSKHAITRLTDREIDLTPEQSKRLENGVEKANEKGIRESLVMVDSLAFIVNVPNKTVVTAMDQNETTDKIFTNIDGAVIM